MFVVYLEFISNKIISTNLLTQLHMYFRALLCHSNGENELILNSPNRKVILKGGPPHGQCDILGRGAYGTVLKAIIGDRRVAVKVINNLNDSNILSLRNEANVLGWNHQHIVKIYQVESTSNFGIVIMERIRGFCLQSILNSIVLPVKHRAFISLDILSALRYCHARNLLHLDVKPQNVFVSPTIWLSKRSYICKLCDFGSSFKYMNAKERTNRRVLQGTVRYMSPESLQNMQLTPASDIYSLGITMWQMKYRRIPYHWIECNDTVAYQVVKHYLRPSTAEIYQEFDTLRGTRNIIYDNYRKQQSNLFRHILSNENSLNTSYTMRRCSSCTQIDATRQSFRDLMSASNSDAIEQFNLSHCDEKQCKLDGTILETLFSPLECMNTTSSMCHMESSYDNIYKNCWHRDPTERPNSQKLKIQIERLKKM